MIRIIFKSTLFLLLLTILAVGSVNSSSLERNSPVGSSINSGEAEKMSKSSVESNLETLLLTDGNEAEVSGGADSGLVRETRHHRYHGGYHGGHGGYYSGGWRRPYGRYGGMGGYGRVGYGYGGRFGYGGYAGGYPYAAAPLANTYCILYPEMCNNGYYSTPFRR